MWLFVHAQISGASGEGEQQFLPCGNDSSQVPEIRSYWSRQHIILGHMGFLFSTGDPETLEVHILPTSWLWQWLFQHGLDIGLANNMAADELLHNGMGCAVQFSQECQAEALKVGCTAYITRYQA